MATSRSRGAAAAKSAPKKATKSAASGRAGSKKASKAPSKAAASRGGKATAARKSPATKAAPSKKSTASRNTSRAGNSGAAARKSAGTSSTARKNTAARASSTQSTTRPQANPRNDLEKILQDLMKDIYYAEKRLVKALGKLAKKTSNEELREAFTNHQSETEEQVAMLEQAFEMIGAKAKAKKCAAMDGLLEEADEHIEEYKKGAGLDAALLVGAQKVEHYEIAAYGSMRSIAQTLGYDDAAEIFDQIAAQEGAADKLLTQIAESIINLEAEGESENEGGNGRGGRSGSKKGGSSRSGSADSEAGEDSSSARSGNEDDDQNDGAGRGMSAMTDGNNRGEMSETGDAMGY